MNIAYSSPKKRKDTGVVATVWPFDGVIEISIIVRTGGMVDVIGSAVFTASQAHTFAKGINAAASIAENKRPLSTEEHHPQSNEPVPAV